MAEQAAARRYLLGAMKNTIRADASAIRAERRNVRERERTRDAAAKESRQRLRTLRQRTRVRLVLYGLVRGRTWSQMERNHPDADAEVVNWLPGAWRTAQLATEQATGVELPTPQALAPYLPAYLRDWLVT